MKSLGRAVVALGMVGSAFAFAGCGDDENAPPVSSAGAPGQGGEPSGGANSGAVASGEAQCRVLGELCHAADTEAGPIRDCHELGHVADGAACATGFAGCVAACVEGSAGEEPLCAALGELCHAVDDETGPLHECHELGHVNDAAVCAAEFDHCAELCLAAREELEHGAGGAQGHPEGGAAHGGAP